MSLEQQIRDAYKTTLGRDVDSDGSLGYWMNQGDNWQSAFQTAASAEIAARKPELTPVTTPAPAYTGSQDAAIAQYENTEKSMREWTNPTTPLTPADYGTFGDYYDAQQSRLPSWSGGKGTPYMRDSALLSYYGAAATVNPFVGSAPGPIDGADPSTVKYILDTQAAAAERGESYWSLGANGEWVQNAGTGSGGGSGGSGGGSGGAGTGGGGPLGMPTTGINLSQLQNPTGWDVQPNETVRSQLQQIIADDSPLMQQARTRALQTANSRGLLNSSMAMTAADSAMYDAAMPIATQDASTYARAGEFNSNTKNTFSRDSNQFVRDAYMADFNVQANDWAAQQQFEREYKMLDRQQQLTLERDAIQNGYTSARDQFAARQQTIRDDKEAALRLQLGQQDTSLERLRIQIDAQTQSDNVANLNALRSEYADKVFRINTSELSPEKADKAEMDLAATYNPMITSAAAKLGYDPASWVIKIEKPEATTTTAASGASGAGESTGGGA